MEKTTDYIEIVGLYGKVQKRTIYTDENGVKYVYNQRRFWELEDFVKNREVIKR